MYEQQPCVPNVFAGHPFIGNTHRTVSFRIGPRLALTMTCLDQFDEYSS